MSDMSKHLFVLLNKYILFAKLLVTMVTKTKNPQNWLKILFFYIHPFHITTVIIVLVTIHNRISN